MTQVSKRSLHTITFALLVMGGLNWLAFGLVGWDVSAIFGDEMRNPIAKIIYALIGTSALLEIGMHRELCSACAGKGAARRDGAAGL